jgi:predicted acyltransferase
MKFVPVPGIGAGLLIPDYNWANYLDFHFLPGSLYVGTWDNEGYLSTIPAVATAMLGIFTGYWLKSKNSPNKKALGLLVGGIISILLALVWDIWFPINKLLWSSSYVLFAGGWSMILLSLFYWVIDVKGYRKWAFPFVVIGVNAIAIYFFGGYISFSGFAKRVVGGMWVTAAGHYGPLLIATATYLATWYLLYWLYKKKIFIKF